MPETTRRVRTGLARFAISTDEEGAIHVTFLDYAGHNIERGEFPTPQVAAAEVQRRCQKLAEDAKPIPEVLSVKVRMPSVMDLLLLRKSQRG